MSKGELTIMDVVLYALYLLGGTKKKIFTEDIAKKSFDLSPSQFSWKRYPKIPDIEPARRNLISARDEKELVKGRAGEVKGLKPSDGWIFSPKGISWIEKNKSRIAKVLGKKEPEDRTDISQKLNEMEKLTAYKTFVRDGDCRNIRPYEFTDFLNASLDTPSTILRDRVDKIKAQAKSEKRQGLLDFMNRCEEHFSSLLKL